MFKRLNETTVQQNWGLGQSSVTTWRDLLETVPIGQLTCGQIGKAQAVGYGMPEDAPFFIQVMTVSQTWGIAIAFPLSTSGKIYMTYKRAQDAYGDWIEM